MTHPLLLWRIVDINGYRNNLHTVPRSKYQQLQFCLITRGKQSKTPQLLQRIQPITGLCIFQVSARLDIKPEIREPIGKAAAFAALHTFQVTITDNQRTRMVQIPLQELPDILRVMLAVAIKSDRIRVAHLKGFLKPMFQRTALASVPRRIYQSDAFDSF